MFMTDTQITSALKLKITKVQHSYIPGLLPYAISCHYISATMSAY